MPASPSLRIQERFVSIQGEGSLVGVPSRFVRVAGCNLRCEWCDTPLSSWTPTGPRIGVDELVESCAAGPRHVVLTGGEPLVFPEIVPLANRLRDAGHHVTVETAATVWQPGFTCDLASMSPKLSHSAPHQRDPIWGARHDARRLRPAVMEALMAFEWQMKFVVRADDAPTLALDLDEIETLLTTVGVPTSARHRVLLMPRTVDPSDLSTMYNTLVPICLERGFRIGQRLHIELFGHTPGT